MADPIAPNSPHRKRMLLQSARSYREQLDDTTRAYLHSRGFDDAMISHAGFGLAAEPVPDHMTARGMLSIPYITPGGGIKAIRFRCVATDHDCKEEGHPKYWGESDVRTGLYNSRDLLSPSETLAVCEGELDAATISGAGILPAVAVPGAQAWGNHFSRMMAGFSKVVLLADGDKAGKDLASKFRRALPSSGRVILCGYQGATDVNEIFVKHGKEALVEMLKESDE